MKRILVVTSSFPSLKENASGIQAGAFLLREIRALISAGYTVKVLMPSIRGLEDFESVPKIELERVSYPLQRYNPGFNQLPQHGNLTALKKLSQLSMALALLRKVFLEIKNCQYQLIWSNWIQVGVICSIANYKKIPHLTSIRGSDIRESKKTSVKIMAKFCRNILNMFAADPEINQWVKEFGFISHAVPSVHDGKSLQLIPSEIPTIVIIGRLHEERSSVHLKGLGINLFEAIKLLFQQGQQFKVIVIGDGANLKSYKVLLAEYSDQITYTGWLDDFSQYLAQATIAVGGGGTNGVIMDTTPHGIPVIISKHICGAIWRDKKNCLVIDPYDVNSIADALRYAILNPHKVLSFGQQAKKDLQEFALPIEDAGVVWRKRIEQFCNSSS